MKKSLLALAALATVAGAAQAQSSVTLYGVADVGVAQLTNSGSFSPNFVTGAVPTSGNNQINGTATGMMNGGQSASRWGIMGSEDLGGGSSAFFRLESGINFASGTVATSGLAGSGANAAANPVSAADTSLEGQLFGRAAYVGLSNKSLGSLQLGRMNSLMLDVIGAGYDPVNAQMFSPINFSGTYGGGGFTDNARVDSAIKYSKQIDAVNVNVLYSMGGVAGNMSARSGMQANIGYESGPFGIQVAYQAAKDVSSLGNAAAANTVTATFYDLQSLLIAGKYQVSEPLTVIAGYENIKRKAASNPLYDVGLTSIYSYSLSSPTAYAGDDIKWNVYWLGLNYQVNPAVKLSTAYYRVNIDSYNKSTINSAGVLGSSSAVGTGKDEYYSVMAEYAFSKRTNLYAAYMHNHKSDAAVVTYNGATYQNFDTYGIGIRHRF